jgi:hypothetical protein
VHARRTDTGAHRMADENIHRSDYFHDAIQLVQQFGLGKPKPRFAMSAKSTA